jgi:Fe2+ transport system protein FeoA
MGRPAQLDPGAFRRPLAGAGRFGGPVSRKAFREKTNMSISMYRFRRHLPRSHKHFSSLSSGAQVSATLAGLRPGQEANLVSFSPEIAPERMNQLQSYGLLPGCLIRVLQNWPVIVVQVEHTELAVENDLARQIFIRGD